MLPLVAREAQGRRGIMHGVTVRCSFAQKLPRADGGAEDQENRAAAESYAMANKSDAYKVFISPRRGL